MECVNIFHFILYPLNLDVPFKLNSLIKANQSVRRVNTPIRNSFVIVQLSLWVSEYHKQFNNIT